MSEGDRAWWEKTLSHLHAARVELASLDANLRSEAEVYLGNYSGREELENVPKAIRQAIMKAKANAK